MRALHVAASLGFILTLAGCATILGGSSQTLTVNSNVEGAEVLLDGRLLGVTPLVVEIERGSNRVLTVRADEYQAYQIALDTKITSLFWLNIISGGLVGSTTDKVTGAMYEYAPSTFMASLQPGGQFGLGLERRKEWQRREGLRAFVLQNSEAVVADLAAGRGEHVDVLVEVLEVMAEDRAEAIERWRASYLSARTAFDFAELIIAELG